MELIGLLGFLGAGKTTALLDLARQASAQGKKVAIIVNEIGDIGIDDALLRRLGNNVWELVGGCICCTLSGELANTLRDIAERHDPDLVLLEPSGASHPDAIFEALKYAKDLPVGATHWLAIVDPVRLDMLVAVLGPLIESHLARADAVVIGKADVASAAQLQAARQWVASTRPGVPTFVTGKGPAGNRLALEALLPA